MTVSKREVECDLEFTIHRSLTYNETANTVTGEFDGASIKFMDGDTELTNVTIGENVTVVIDVGQDLDIVRL